MTKKPNGRPSSVETSPHRREIEEMLREGKKPDFIVTWLKNMGVSISRSAIYRYKKDKFNIKAEAVKKYNDEKSKERLDDASDEYKEGMNFLYKVVKTAAKVKLDLNVKPDFQKETQLNIENHKLNIIKAGIQATKGISEILEDESDSPTFIFNLDSKKERLKRIEGTNDYSNSQKNSTRNKSDS